MTVLAPDFAPRVVQWQRIQGRQHLPWQATREPYRVWLSEIMLQQTQVQTVLAYYSRFLAQYPDVAALAAAPLDDVLTAWSGLGYYSRARNLHRCAQVVMQDHQGRFPPCSATLRSLPGIGRSTAAAIASFCYHERAAILDGNVKRVLSRVTAFGEDLSTTAAQRKLWALAETVLPTTPADMPAYTQGLMDLGATVCTRRRPQCLICPVQPLCQARRQSRPEHYPVTTRKLRRTHREQWWLCLIHEGQVWIQQRPEVGVWAGLWTLPLLDAEDAAQALIQQLSPHPPPQPTGLPAIEHALTHFDWTLHPLCVDLTRPQADRVPSTLGAGRWLAFEAAEAVALPAPLKKWLPTAQAWTRTQGPTPQQASMRLTQSATTP